MSAAKRRGAHPTRKSGRRYRARGKLKVIQGEPPAFMTVRVLGTAFSVQVCLSEGDCRPVMTFRTGKEARIYALKRARRLSVEVRT